MSTKPSLRNPSISSHMQVSTGNTSVLPLPNRTTSPSLSHSNQLTKGNMAHQIQPIRSPSPKAIVVLVAVLFAAVILLLFGSSPGSTIENVTAQVSFTIPPSPATTLSKEVTDERRTRTEELFRQLGMHVANLAGEQQELAAQRLHIGKGKFGGTISSTDLHAAQYFDVDNVVFSCFYNNKWIDDVPAAEGKGYLRKDVSPAIGSPTRDKAQDFYVGNRKVPTLDWIEVFMRSVADVTASPKGRLRKASNEQGSGHRLALTALEEAAIGDNRTRLVMFVDFGTWRKLRRMVADLEFMPYDYLHKELGMYKRAGLVADLHAKKVKAERDGDVLDGDTDRPKVQNTHRLRRPLVQFVVVAFPKDESLLRAALNTIPLDQYPDLVLPSYLDSKWAAEVRNGANNFRFALYRDWLSRYASHAEARSSHQANVELGEAKKEDRANNRNKAVGELSEAFEPISAVDNLLNLKMAVVDATDVAFQRNPFQSNATGGCFGHPAARAASSKHGLRVPLVIGTLENSKMTFKKEKYNRRWMSCFDNGKDLNRLAKAHRPIACAGVTLGNGAGMYTYFTAQLLQIVRPPLVQCALSVISAALDQATHNYLLHSMSPPGEITDRDIKLLGSSSEALLAAKNNGGVGDDDAARLLKSLSHFPAPPKGETLSISDPENPVPLVTKPALPVSVVLANHERDHCTFHGNFGQLRTFSVDSSEVGEGTSEGTTVLAVNPDGQVYDIVHQYSSDRHPILMEALSKRYLRKR